MHIGGYPVFSWRSKPPAQTGVGQSAPQIIQPPKSFAQSREAAVNRGKQLLQSGLPWSRVVAQLQREGQWTAYNKI